MADDQRCGAVTGKAGGTGAEPDRHVGAEARKTYAAKLDEGFIEKYLSGMAILDIGYKGYENDIVPIVPQAIGIDVDYPGYDGRSLPFPDESQDAVFSSHCLEHVNDAKATISEWFRVLRTDGFLVICVPHQHLYERKSSPPSRWNPDHRRFYTPATLLIDVEDTLKPNTYRLRHLADNDAGYDYSIPPDQHPGGCYEIELVIQKIRQPAWHMDAGEHIGAPPPATPSSLPLGPNCATALVPTAGSPSAGDDGVIRPSIGDRSASRQIFALSLDDPDRFLVGISALASLRRIWRRLAVGRRS
jgi:SAM-dependent methyltransferase